MQYPRLSLSILLISLFLNASLNFSCEASAKKSDDDENALIAEPSKSLAPSPSAGASPSASASVDEMALVPQEDLIPRFPSGIMGTVLSYLSVKEIVGIHRAFPGERRAVTIALANTPSPILWNFHDPLYSLARFQSIFIGLHSSQGMDLKLINIDVPTLTTVLPHLSSASTLDISNNELGREGALALAERIPPRLDYLSVATNGIDDEGLTKLLRSLKGHPTLRTLNITWNPVKGSGTVLPAVRELVKQGVTLQASLRMW